MSKTYLTFGVALTFFGLIIAMAAYFVIDSTPLVSVGLSACIVGVTSAGLANSRPRLSPEACQLFLRTGVGNITMILEELETKNKAVYLPRSMRDGVSQVIIPLYEDSIAGYKENLRGNMIVAFGNNEGEKALVITTIGNACLDMLDGQIGQSAEEIQSTLTYVLSRSLDIASDIDVTVADAKVNVEVNESDLEDLRLLRQNTLYTQLLGSPVASISAAICCEAFNKPIRISYETTIRGKTVIMLNVLSLSTDSIIEMVLP